MGMLSRMSTIVKSKMNRILDNAEDPRETLDYSYEKQLEMLRNVKRGVVEMVAAKRQIVSSRPTRCGITSPAWSVRPSRPWTPGARTWPCWPWSARTPPLLELQGLDEQIAGMEEEQEKLTQAEAAALGQGGCLPQQEGSHQGPVHRRPGPGAHRLGPLGHLGRDGRRGPGGGAGRGQDREYAGPGQRHRRAGRGRCAGDPVGGGKDDITRELEKMSVSSSAETELAALKARRPGQCRNGGPAMIVRISSEGQYNLPGSYIDQLNEIDNELVEAVAAEDQGAFETAPEAACWTWCGTTATPVPVDELVESDLILPEPDLTLLEAEELFVGEGLLPGVNALAVFFV